MARSRTETRKPLNAMPALERPEDIVYPESDGKPLGETPLHRDELVELVFRLRRHFADDPTVYVSGNMMMYYQAGNPRASLSPDVFVALGAGERYRRVYKIWEEACGPTFVVEVSSLATAREDRGRKKDLFARLGVVEYWLYDPEGEYLEPPLQGFRLSGWRYVPIAPDEAGVFTSDVLGLELRLVDGLLEVFDPASGERLLRMADAVDERNAAVGKRNAAVDERDLAVAARDAAVAARDAAVAARDAVLEQAAALEAQVASVAAARRDAELAREAADAARIAEEAAREAAEAEAARLRAEIARLRGEADA